MLCDSCHQRPASCHVTSIVEDVMEKRDLCEECFEAMSPEKGPTASLKAGCRYCGAEAFCAGTDFLAIAVGIQEARVLCMACNEELQSFTDRELNALPKGLSQQKQLVEIQQLRERADAHMRRWVSQKGSI